MNHSRPFSASPSRRPAFTLVELMISIALALLLIYGISQVFKMSGDTVGAQQAVSANVRDQRAASATMTEDYRNSLPDSPLFLISNRIAYGYDATAKSGFHAGFKNAEEERNGDPSGDPTIQDINGSTFITPIARGSDRTPRLDRLGFFARNIYRSQMANNAQMTSGVAGGEAYIWYGHVAVLNVQGNRTQPQDQYASDRVLGRVAILMKDGPTPVGTFPDDRLFPLGYTFGLYQSVQDWGPVTVEQWRQKANNAYNKLNPATPGAWAFNWYLPMLDPNPSLQQYWRSWCKPTLSRPINQAALSQTVPFFVGNCTQFIVEYAGDFVDQDENDPLVPGRVVDVKKKRRMADSLAGNAEVIETDTPEHRLLDGDQIDYIIDTSGDVDPNTGQLVDPPANPSKWVKKIRWYGLPRDVNGDGFVTINDVVPLADVLAYYDSVTALSTTTTPPNIKTSDGKLPWAPWEAEVPAPGLVNPTLQNSLVSNGKKRTNEPNWQHDYGLFPASQANAFRYTCAFHNDAPMMIRITMKVDDPTGRIKDGQWFQYILSR